MNEFKDQLDVSEKEKVTKLVTELRELAAKGQTGDASVSADNIRDKISETQTASLGLFQKVSSLLVIEVDVMLTSFRSMKSVLLRIRHLSNLLLNHPRKRRKTKRSCPLFTLSLVDAIAVYRRAALFRLATSRPFFDYA
jgi:hypothetical protein